MQSAGENARAFLLNPSNSIPNPSLSRMRVNHLPVFLMLCGHPPINRNGFSEKEKTTGGRATGYLPGVQLEFSRS
jgi:hypothetical protein